MNVLIPARKERNHLRDIRMANINHDAVDAALEWRMEARTEDDNVRHVKEVKKIFKSCAVFLTKKLI